MKQFLLALAFAAAAGPAFSQQFGKILVSDYDDPLIFVEGAAVFYGKELLGTTDHTGSFAFPKKVKGNITLEHPNFGTRTLKVKTKEGLIIDTNMVVKPHIYDSLKTVYSAIVYEKCIREEVKTVTLSEATSVSKQALDDYIARTMRYPKRARDNGEQGTVLLRFRIGPDGLVNCVEVVKGVSYELDKEAFRILAGMPKWSPAKRGGAPVSAVYSVEIPFVIR